MFLFYKKMLNVTGMMRLLLCISLIQCILSGVCVIICAYSVPKNTEKALKKDTPFVIDSRWLKRGGLWSRDYIKNNWDYVAEGLNSTDKAQLNKLVDELVDKEDRRVFSKDLFDKNDITKKIATLCIILSNAEEGKVTWFYLHYTE